MTRASGRHARACATSTTTRSERLPRHKARGQSLVEFALIFPLFILLLLAIIEFMFLFNAQLSLNFTTRDAALIAAEAGSNANADCQILQQVDKDLNPPTDVAMVVTVHIFSATEEGAPLATPKEQTYTRSGTTTCGTTVVPYSACLTCQNYPPVARCSDLDRTGCVPGNTGPGNTGVDIIGVRVDYNYQFVTPLGSALVGGGASGMTMSTGNAMRMEPIL